MEKNKGGRPRKLTPVEEMAVYQLYKEQLSITEIAYKFGVSVPTILRITRKMKEGETDGK